MKKEFVPIAETHSQSASIQMQSAAQNLVGSSEVGPRSVKIKSIKDAGREDVYNMYVSNTNCFSVNGGLIIHNCDALRYALFSHCGHGPSGIVASIMV